MKKIYENKKIIIIIGGIIILILCLLSFIFKDKTNEEEISFNTITKNMETTTKESKSFYVDVKGSVKKPGVYEFKDNDRVIDAIELAGGLTKNANTSNINLSQKLKSEMVIYVYSDSEVKKGAKSLSCNTICETKVIEVNNCVPEIESKIENDGIININTATKEEIMTLSGIGESKAESIIEYRNSKGNFKTIEDLKKVSGIGESLFEKIKDKITI